jgi:error-prone DNA polymerase
MSYVPLWCKSNFSFLEGASHPAELVEAADEKGLDAIALTDRDGFYGMVEAHSKAEELDVDLIVGVEVSIRNWGTMNLYPMSREGYGNLCELLSIGQQRTEKGDCWVTWPEVCAHAGELLAAWGGDISWNAHERGDVLDVGRRLAEDFDGRLYVMIPRHRLPEGPANEERLIELADELEVPTVAVNEVLYHDIERRSLQDILTCIREGVTIHESAEFRKSNGEYRLKTPDAFESLFEDIPDAVSRTVEFAERCEFSMSDLEYRYPSEVGESETSFERLRRLSIEGAYDKYGEPLPDEVKEQIEDELSLIEELEYAGYFLTMKEIVNFCKTENIMCQGRGSAANSVVCYCLGITAIDPVRMELLFERFISRERDEPPDIDLDIEHDRREEVIQHVYDKYGRDRAAMVANVIRYRPKSAIRDVAKALGFKQTKIERLAESVSSYQMTPELFDEAGFNPDLHLHQLCLEHVAKILDFPRHLSLHPGGFVLGKHPVNRLVPVENASKDDRTCIQWDKYHLEELGLFKVDLLGLGALTQLHRSFDLIEKYYGESLSMDTIPAGDDDTYEMICDADTIGVFQIESRAQMSMLPRLKPQNYYDLVVEISLVRPGPIEGEMVHPYLRRRQGDEEVTYPHESLKPVLKKTLGVPLFQEQVMKLAMVAADYTPGEADQLRRDMGFRSQNALEKHRSRMIPSMIENGIEPEYAERIFKQIQGFGSYGFPESHAASFALIAYATSYVRCHYLPAFVCSILNSQPMGFYSVSTIVEDAKRHDLEIRSLDINYSDWDCTMEVSSGDCPPFNFPPEGGKTGELNSPSLSPQRGEIKWGENQNRQYKYAVRMGARFVKGLAEKQWERIQAERQKRPFVSLRDFMDRVDVSRDTIDVLAEAGAFEGLEANRRRALWRLKGLVETTDNRLGFDEMVEDRQVAFRDLNQLEQVQWDYDSNAYSPSNHPLGPIRDRMKRLGLPSAKQLEEIEDGRVIHYAGIVIVRQRPGTASGVCFLTLEDETGLANALLWPDIYDQYRRLVRTEPFLGVTGEVQREEGVMHIITRQLWRPDLQAEPPSGDSHDFC